ncbi:MAG: GDP-mannose 4,6-dehydratase [Microthrixaceae bacterium]
MPGHDLSFHHRHMTRRSSSSSSGAHRMICHLAAQIDVRISVSDPLLDARVNIIGTLNVPSREPASSGTDKVVFASSGGTIYGAVDESDSPVAESRLRRCPARLHGPEEGGGRLHARLPGAPRPRVHRPGPRQRLRTPAGSPRRGGCRGDLRGTPAAG